MIQKPLITVFFLIEKEDAGLASFFSYLRSMSHMRLAVAPQLPSDLSSYNLVVTSNIQNSEPAVADLTRFVRAGGGWLLLVDLSEQPLPEIFGVQPETAGPQTELRILFEKATHPLAARLADAIYLRDRHQALTHMSDDIETILYADWHYTHSAVLTCRRVERGQAACTTLQAYSDPQLQQILYRLLAQLAGCPPKAMELGIGLLGYAPSVGQIHGLGAEKTAGLKLEAICDLNPDRLHQAHEDFPDIKTYASTEKLADDPAVDLVIVATPPNSHARLCMQMMSAAKHVVSEKPLALSRRETDALQEMAVRQNVHLSCHQNRRWDPDYMAIKQSLGEGWIGDCFYLETFVGGFHHPCGYWHSHAAVSGGASYDWGAHYLDWIVSLIPEAVETVVGTRHKRVWHDVTNADQERIQIRFAGGQEAEFLNSDIAAARKPKWFLLGTAGAIVGHWQDVAAYQIDPIHYFERHDIPATEMIPELYVFRRHQTGQVMKIRPAVPAREHYPFHRNLADHLLLGEPLVAPLADSVTVVAILEAAARSMEKGGTVEVVNG